VALVGGIAILFCAQLNFKPDPEGATTLEGAKYLSMPASCLIDVRQAWIDRGRPESFKPNKVIGGTFGNVFFYTNKVQVGGMIYQCRFGVSDNVWPPGILAITDEGIVLWIRQRDGKVTVSPEKNWIER